MDTALAPFREATRDDFDGIVALRRADYEHALAQSAVTYDSQPDAHRIPAGEFHTLTCADFDAGLPYLVADGIDGTLVAAVRVDDAGAPDVPFLRCFLQDPADLDLLAAAMNAGVVRHRAG